MRENELLGISGKKKYFDFFVCVKNSNKNEQIWKHMPINSYFGEIKSYRMVIFEKHNDKI